MLCENTLDLAQLTDAAYTLIVMHQMVFEIKEKIL